MTGIELAAVITAACTGVATLIGSIGAFIVLFRKVNQVEKTTNSLSVRAEASARATGIAEGNLQGRGEQTAERKVERADRIAEAAIAAPQPPPVAVSAPAATAVIVSGALALKTEDDKKL